MRRLCKKRLKNSAPLNMKYTAKLYAKAFLEYVHEKKGHIAEEELKRFTSFVLREGDKKIFPKIIHEAERILRKEHGGKEVLIESARPLEEKLRAKLLKQFSAKDAVSEAVRPDLVAGVIVT